MVFCDMLSQVVETMSPFILISDPRAFYFGIENGINFQTQQNINQCKPYPTGCSLAEKLTQRTAQRISELMNSIWVRRPLNTIFYELHEILLFFFSEKPQVQATCNDHKFVLYEMNY